jgi:DNA-binding CsgD family transcriptional regulator
MAMTTADAVRLALGELVDDGPTAGLPPPRSGKSAQAGGLTPREQEVVALLGAGLSNRDIAGRLFISPATAARHVANILAKLGFSSRSQVAVWANGGQVAAEPGPLAPDRPAPDQLTPVSWHRIN